MEMKVLSKEKNTIEIELIDVSKTFLNPLIQKLLKDDKVEFATCSRKHPLVDHPKLYIKTKSGEPIDAFLRAAKALVKESCECKKIVQEMGTNT
ncbi:MAG: DNA-directed RNA polymerase subunit L [Thermoplasmata archaeon]